MQDVSGFGLQLRIIASNTFPAGFPFTEFADDVDPFDLPELQIADSAMGLNGDLVVWSLANPVNITIGAIPKTEGEKNLAVLLEANRPARGKRPARDEITIVAMYPDGSSLTVSKGKLLSGLPGNPVASAGRYKSKPYGFTFEQMTKVEL